MGSSIINVPITIKDRMVGFVMNARIWLFADHIYNPSYWLILKREGFSGNINFNSVELSYELVQFDRDALTEIYRIHHGEFPNPGIGSQLLPEVEHLILSGRVKVFVLELDLLTRVGDPYDPLMNESQGFYDSGEPVLATRNQLAEELGRVIGTRWLGKDSADQLHWDRSVIIREMVERYDEGVAVVDTVIDVIVGLWEIGVFAVKLVGSIVEFQLDIVGKAVTGDFEGIKDQLLQLGIDTVNSVQDAITKAKQGYDILQRLNKDPQSQALLYDFFDSLYQSIHYRDTRTIGIRIISAVGIEVLIALATAGAGNVARVAASSAAKTVNAARGSAAVARNIGPFTAKSIDLMGDLAKLLKSNTKIPDEHLDLPPVEPMKIPESGKLGVEPRRELEDLPEKDSSDYGVAFFGEDNLNYYTRENATIGRQESPFFLMPIEDSTAVKNSADAALYTGRAPSAEAAYLNDGDIYGISFPIDTKSLLKPTAEDAGYWPHFLEGGHTAVKTGDGVNAGYLVNPTREFVIPGGEAVPTGSVLFKLGPNGEWSPIRKF
ncbi:hypothetical protein NBRC116493_25130 [Aurantivibrio infirmus]